MTLIVGQNAAWQKTCLTTKIRLGEVNRMTASFGSAGGKGANSARALAGRGYPVMLLSYAGGIAGDRYRASCEEDGVGIEIIRIAEETRTCTTLIDADGNATEIIEPAPEITDTESQSFVTIYKRFVPECALVVIAGTAVSGESLERYREYTATAHKHGVPVLLDAYKAHGREALEAGPDILKINSVELAEITGGSAESFDERRRASNKLAREFGIRWIVVTTGRGGAEAFTDEYSVHAKSPEIVVKNSIGSGDAFTAGIASAIIEAGSLKHTDIGEALRRGTAMGSANCLDIIPGRLADGDFQRLYAEVMLTE